MSIRFIDLSILYSLRINISTPPPSVVSARSLLSILYFSLLIKLFGTLESSFVSLRQMMS